MFSPNNIRSTREMKRQKYEARGLCFPKDNERGFGHSFETNFENYRAWERISDFSEEKDIVGVE